MFKLEEPKKSMAHNIETLTRRRFMQAASAGASLLTTLPMRAKAALPLPDRAYEHGDPLAEFGYADISLAEGPHRSQMLQTHSILMGLDEDGLLRPFRLAAGLPAPGRDLGGGYSSPIEFGPENFGHWMSALARFYAMSGDAATRETVKRWLALCSEALDIQGSIFKQFKQTSCCIYNKLLCGFQDAYFFTGLTSALDVLEHMTSAAQPYMPGRAMEQTAPDNGGESYTIPEYQLVAWQRGAQPRHLQMARDYLHDEFFDPLARGENVLPGRHAYSHVNALCSAAKAYLVLGDEKYLKAAVNGLAFVERQSFATGGWGIDERFIPKPAVEYTNSEGEKNELFPAVASLGEALVRTSRHFETPCGSQAHFKLTRYLLRITKDSRYGDSMERVMYNTVLGALPLNTLGKAFYQSSYHTHAHKDYFDGYGHRWEDEWPCCSGTLPQVATDYGINAYFKDRQGIFVNLYIPSTLRWRQDNAEILLTQSGQYPLADEIAFEIVTSRPVSFSLRLRIPSWAQGASVWVNGHYVAERMESGAFTTIRRQWRSSDRIKLTLPRPLEIKAVDEQHPNRVCVIQGPLVLFALSEDTPKVSRAQLLRTRQTGERVAEWKTDTAGGVLTFVPFWVIKGETYFTYLDV